MSFKDVFQFDASACRFHIKPCFRRKVAAIGFIGLIAAVAVLLNARADHRVYTVRSSDAQSQTSRAVLHARLSLQPEADRLRRRLGKRFLAPGREVTFLIGALTFGSERYTARITRIQDLDDERLTVALNDGEPSLTWSAREGVKSDGNQVEGSLRTIVERLALDSPDQFIFAQLRGAAYFTAARLVRPAEAGASDNYSGPLWNIVRISEPSGGAQNRPQSLWRLYYTNAATGLIDKVLSREQGRTVAAEFSEWVNQGGELTPVRTVWKLNDQEVMSLTLANLTYSPKQ